MHPGERPTPSGGRGSLLLSRDSGAKQPAQMDRAPDEQQAFLGQVLARAAGRSGREHALVLLDLDSTLYDNRPRTLRILREWAAARSGQHPAEAARIQAIRPEVQRYRIDQTLSAAGITDE